MKRLIVWLTSEDRKKSLIEGVLTHINGKVKLLNCKSPGTPALSLEIEEIDRPTFVLDSEKLSGIRDSDAILILMLTPNLIAQDSMLGEGMNSIIEMHRSKGLTLLPAYCIKIGKPEDTPWHRINWLPYSVKSFKAISEYADKDEAGAALTEALSQILETPEPVARQVVAPQPLIERSSLRVEPSSHTRTIEDSKIPHFAIFGIPEDLAAAKGRLEPLISILERKGVRSYAPWRMLPGANRELRRELALYAPQVVLLVSAGALASEQLYSTLTSLSQTQCIRLVLLKDCIWEFVLESFRSVKTEVFPSPGCEARSLAGARNPDAIWTDVFLSVWKAFANEVAQEDPTVLSNIESRIVEFHDKARTTLSPDERDKYERLSRDATVYYNK